MNENPLTDEVRAMMADHLARYLATDGEEGFWFRGNEHLILTTIGRRSRQERSTPLIFGTDADRYLVVASLGGYDKSPQWFHNLVSDPHVTVQVKADRFAAIARTASAQERPRLWAQMVEVFPTYAEYQTMTDRELPVVILDRAT